MSESFSVGEIAIIANAHPYFARYIGTECEIVGICGHETDMGAPCDYFIHCADGFRCYAARRNLRKRRPPPDWVKLCKLTDLPREVVCE